MVVVLGIFSKEKKLEYIILLDRLNELKMKFMTVLSAQSCRESCVFIELGYCRKDISWA